jgi:D-sedoheptulose 7-phosphate isomerase
MPFFTDYFADIARKVEDVDAIALDRLSRLLHETQASGHKVILVGNGGSAAIASHLAIDLTKAAGIRATTFNEAALITCFANDYGYDRWVQKALDFYGDAEDTAVLISSSGRSSNVINGAKTARARGLRVVTLTGFDADNPLRGLGDVNFWVNSRVYNVIEMTHHIWLLAAVDKLVAENGHTA